MYVYFFAFVLLASSTAWIPWALSAWRHEALVAEQQTRAEGSHDAPDPTARRREVEQGAMLHTVHAMMIPIAQMPSAEFTPMQTSKVAREEAARIGARFRLPEPPPDAWEVAGLPGPSLWQKFGGYLEKPFYEGDSISSKGHKGGLRKSRMYRKK